MVAVCLAFGVLVNYGVAWWYVCGVVRTAGYSQASDYEIEINGQSLKDWPVALDSPFTWPRNEFRHMHSIFQFTEIVDFGANTDDDDRSHRLNQISVGWPLLSHQSTRKLSFVFQHGPAWSQETWLDIDGPPAVGFAAGIRIDKEKFSTRAYGNVGDWPFLPLAPIWPGFAINTLLYATVPALILLPWGPLKRYRRRRRGACLKCGYDLSATVASVCPECGGTP